MSLILLGALAGAVFWGSCQARGKSLATQQLEATLAQHDSLKAVAAAHRDSLFRVVHALRSDSALLAIQRNAVRSQAKDSIGKLLALVADSAQRAAAAQAVKVVYLEVEACQDQLTNCEARAQNAEARARGDSVSLAATAALLDTVRLRWSQAERRAQPSFFRDLWRSRQVTLPLAALSLVLILKR